MSTVAAESEHETGKYVMYVPRESGVNRHNIDMLLKKKIDCIVIDNYFSFQQNTYVVTERDTSFVQTDQGPDIRSDRVAWIKSDHTTGLIAEAVAAISTLVSELVLVGNISLACPSQLQLASYNSGGSHYIAHRDNKPRRLLNLDDDALWMSNAEQRYRYLTCILYLTPPDWDASRDGGALRCYCGAHDDDSTGDSANCVVDIEPLRGRLVLFLSEELLHEVLPTRRDGRVALTAWVLNLMS